MDRTPINCLVIGLAIGLLAWFGWTLWYWGGGYGVLVNQLVLRGVRINTVMGVTFS